MDTPDTPELWQRIAAFRDLLHKGAPLLGQIVEHAQAMQISADQLAAERKLLDEQRDQLAKDQAELAQQREQFAQERRAVELDQRMAKASLDRQAETLASRDRQLTQIVEEGERRREATRAMVAVPAESNLNLDEEHRLLELLKAKLSERRKSGAGDETVLLELQAQNRSLEVALEQTQGQLRSERERRNRAINLIRPVSPTSSSS